jgi:hypothetical protein
MDEAAKPRIGGQPPEVFILRRQEAIRGTKFDGSL